MAFEFVENLTLTLPDIESKLDQFAEGSFSENHGLVVEIAAIHEGLTANFNFYSEAELQRALTSWTQPYEKPIILNHDVMTEPLGRVIGARMDKEADGIPFVRLQVAITSPEAIQKVKDRRYLTGSVGGKADEALCNICGIDWASPKESSGLPCTHRRGKIYKGKMAYMEMRNIGFKEYSFVNVPADSKSTVVGVGESDDTYENKARFFVLDMVSEGIVECTESENKDILANLKKKEATPLYLGLKGAFLSALAVEESEKSAKEDKDNTNSQDSNDLSEETLMAQAHETQDEDVLSIMEGLSEDLSKVSDVEEETTEVTESEETEEVSEETEVTEETEESEDEVEEGERPEGQEKPSEKDVDPNDSSGAPASRESDEEETTEEVTETEEQDQDEELSEEQNETVTEPLEEDLKSEVETLREENARLKKALYRTLVEKVVDAKISVGMIDADDKAEAMEEHSTRTASSLADSLKDLAKVTPKSRETLNTSELTMDVTSEVVGEEEQVITIGDEEDSGSTTDPIEKATDVFVDALMGRVSLQF